MKRYDHSFTAMGSRIRLIAEGGAAAARDLALAVADAERFIRDFDRRLSRFRPTSELTALNEDPRETVPASGLLRHAVRAGLRAAYETDGPVDPTLAGELERAGYAAPWRHATSAPLSSALQRAGIRRAAAPNPRSRWRDIEVEDVDGVIHRPAGVRLDTGGTGKGLAADLVAPRFAGFPRFVVDCGGDMRIGGTSGLTTEVLVEHPLTREYGSALAISRGAVATSALSERIWRGADGRFAHHLLDPSTGRPAWTGLIGATALAPTALEAETLAKAALLSGPVRARVLLAERGGLIVHDSGQTEVVGPAPVSPRCAITVPRELAGARAA